MKLAKPDREAAEALDAAVAHHLMALVTDHGDELALDHRKVARLLCEQFEGRPRPLILLHVACREGVAGDLATEAGGSISSIVFERLARRLFDRAGVAPEHASWAVESWANALGVKPPKRLSRLRAGPSLQPVSKEPVSGPVGAPWTMKGHRRAVSCIAFSPDGSRIATSGLDRTVRLWNGRSGDLERVLFGGHRDWVRSVAFSPDGRTVASGGDDGAIRLWDARTGERRFRLAGHDGWVRSVAFSPDGRVVASGGRDGVVALWEVSSLQVLARLEGFEGGVSRISYDPGGRWMAVGYSGAVQVWDLSKQKRQVTIEVQGERPVVAGAPDDLVVVGDDVGVASFRASDGTETARYEGHEGAVRAVAVHPNGKSLATGGRDQTVRIWNTAWGWETWRVETGRKVTSLSFHPGGHLAMAFADGKAEYWEMKSEAGGRP